MRVELSTGGFVPPTLSPRPISVMSTTTATAKEDSGRRTEITQMFSEIGPYPNNYSGGRVFTQTEVEKYIKQIAKIIVIKIYNIVFKIPSYLFE